jgi:hypothetical protein
VPVVVHVAQVDVDEELPRRRIGSDERPRVLRIDELHRVPEAAELLDPAAHVVVLVGKVEHVPRRLHAASIGKVGGVEEPRAPQAL